MTSGTTISQLKLDLSKRAEDCIHEFGFVTMACVPAGYFCGDCESLVFQYIPQSPDRLGYESADWAWKHRHGRNYTTLP